MSSTNEEILVYVPDITLDITDKDVKGMIQTYLEKAVRMQISDITCYAKLGVAIIRLKNEDDKIRLVSDVQSIVLNSHRNIIISFADKLELDSCIVFDQNAPISKIPSCEKLIDHIKQTYNRVGNFICELLFPQIPNIFHITFNSFNDLVEFTNSSNFQIEGTLATVFPRVTYSILEDLPRTINADKIRSAIMSRHSGKEFSSTELYIQYNRNAGEAVILISRSAKGWAIEKFLKIDEQNLPKKTAFTCRVLISPVPRDFNVNRILDNSLFQNKVNGYRHVTDILVLELDSIDIYKDALAREVINIDDNIMKIKPYAIVIDPEITDLDAENWYQTDMFKIEPDIIPLLSNHQHPIFHYRWNARNWIEQFQKLASLEQHSQSANSCRHLLRVTVMLNTIGVLRRRRYTVFDEEISLKPVRMRTIVYDHASKLSLGVNASVKKLKIPYPSTSVRVVNEDCLVVYQRLVSEGFRPLLLNMANQSSPGGGYRKGDGAQEENLFRRSNYYQSLDVEIADGNESERLRCNGQCKFTEISKHDRFYPMDDFGAIYTTDITVFRQTEAKGYEFMRNPLCNVSAVAMAAHWEPKLKNNRTLDSRFAATTRKKIENIFAIAYHQQHDCLVLSAFGCGAFKNPPAHIAAIFKSVIYQYAGFFKTIYFAIVDDHNTGNRTNPEGNLAPFQDILNNLTIPAPVHFHIDAAIGSSRIIEKSSDEQLVLSDVRIFDLPPCRNGAKCGDHRNPHHRSQFSHPPMCPLSKATSSCEHLNDEVHAFTFIHNTKCKLAGECSDTSPTHFIELDHPEFCQLGGNCTNMTKTHLIAFRHIVNCPHGLKCPKYRRRDMEHTKSFRHCRSVCFYDNSCANFHDREHFANTVHSFRSPCPFTPYNCSRHIEVVQTNKSDETFSDAENHCFEYSHVCPFGRQCRNTEESHFETSIHIARQLCADGDRCSKLSQEDHLELFSHAGIRDIRLLCKIPGYKCSNRFDINHFKKYRHDQCFDHFSTAPSSNLNASIDFAHNQSHLIGTVNKYIEKSNFSKSNINPDILSWIRALQPVHRCRKEIFESILILGHVMSRHYMVLLEKPENVVKAVQQHNRMRSILLKYNNPGVKENVRKLIEIIVDKEFKQTTLHGKTYKVDDSDKNIATLENKLQPPLEGKDIQAIHEWASKIAKASIALNLDKKGIGYAVDPKLGTDMHVFSIVGPHLGHYYGEIVITFKQEIMFHPDANFTIQAGTSFHSGNIYKRRPWMKDSGIESKRIEHFHKSKLHCCVPRYEYATATELIARAGYEHQSMNVNLEMILEKWKSVDSHETLEGHLPQLIPLDYVECVYIPKNTYESLSPEAQQLAKAVFKDSLKITTYDSDGLNTDHTPKEMLENPYSKFVFEELCEAIKRRMDKPQVSRGIVITIGASDFGDHVILPVAISQAHYLYYLDKPKPPDGHESIYIYWQAMDGDMMLTLSNKTIEPAADEYNLKCLVCYIAKKPSVVAGEYHEAFSYLNDGLPYQHGNNIDAARFRAKSNGFYRGCNINDYLTFCLKLNYKTGKVTLSHAGPNSLYNHEKIECHFTKAELDLALLNFIHLSSGTQDVPVRNLTINFEPIPELHPAPDANFKQNTSSLLERYLVITAYGNTEGMIPNQARREQPSIMNRLSNISTSIFSSPIINVLCCRHTNVVEPMAIEDVRPKLPPCKDSIYCLQQNSRNHAKQFSHPCRFCELCTSKAREPHLTHEPNHVMICKKDRNCSEKVDPVHRAKFRHTGLPDYLIPCRKQTNCPDQSLKHRIKYFHGETIPIIISKTSDTISAIIHRRFSF